LEEKTMSKEKPSIAVILSGCGNRDGSEIHEATMTLWAIHRHGAEYQCYAPNRKQYHVLNHLTGEEMPEQRNVLIESARIARGKIKDLAVFDEKAHDILILPGGLGAAKNLSTYAFDGPQCTIDETVAKAVRAMHAAKKPIGALCIAPVILARLLPGISLTIGQDPHTAGNIAKMGARHQETTHGEITADSDRRIVTTPCYMLEARVDQIGEGADRLVAALLAMIG
jgi:enhancing lycopene biosynthesis protein 2